MCNNVFWFIYFININRIFAFLRRCQDSYARKIWKLVEDHCIPKVYFKDNKVEIYIRTLNYKHPTTNLSGIWKLHSFHSSDVSFSHVTVEFRLQERTDTKIHVMYGSDMKDLSIVERLTRLLTVNLEFQMNYSKTIAWGKQGRCFRFVTLVHLVSTHFKYSTTSTGYSP